MTPFWSLPQAFVRGKAVSGYLSVSFMFQPRRFLLHYSALHLDLQVFLQFVGQLIAVTFVHTGVINAFFTHIGSSQLVK